MSFDGYYQKLCANGHYSSHCAYEDGEEPDIVCPHCTEPIVFKNFVNTTKNNAGSPLTFKLLRHDDALHINVFEIPREEDLEVRDLVVQECDAIKELLLQKNKEYGNSAFVPINIFSGKGSVDLIKVRIDDKLSRIAATRGLDSIEFKEDTVLDLIGYLVLLRVAQKMGEGGE